MNDSDGISTGPLGPELLGRLLDGHAAALELYAGQFCDCPEDVVQEAFLEFVGQKVLPRDPVAWLYRVVRNMAIDACRAGRRRKEHEKAFTAGCCTWFVPSSGESLDAATAKCALESLLPDEREVVVARLWGGLTFEQIAELVGVSDSTVFRRYESALEKLREKLRIPCRKNTR